jgi:hypothetical protein
LSRNQRTQYDSAKRLVTESEEAFKASNFEISRSIAEKAEALVKELQNR